MGQSRAAFDTPAPDTIALPLVSPWVAYGAGFFSPVLTVDDSGTVCLNGLVKGGTGPSYIGVVPPQYCTDHHMLFPCLYSDGANHQLGWITFNYATRGIYVNQTFGSVGSWVSLDMCRWKLTTYVLSDALVDPLKG